MRKIENKIIKKIKITIIILTKNNDIYNTGIVTSNVKAIYVFMDKMLGTGRLKNYCILIRLIPISDLAQVSDLTQVNKINGYIFNYLQLVTSQLRLLHF